MMTILRQYLLYRSRRGHKKKAVSVANLCRTIISNFQSGFLLIPISGAENVRSINQNEHEQWTYMLTYMHSLHTYIQLAFWRRFHVRVYREPSLSPTIPSLYISVYCIWSRQKSDTMSRITSDNARYFQDEWRASCLKENFSEILHHRKRHVSWSICRHIFSKCMV